MANYNSLEALLQEINTVITSNGTEGINGVALNRILVGLAEFIGTDEGGGGTGAPGFNGWNMIPAIEADGVRRVLKIVDWFGGSGTKPAGNLYIGASGFVQNIGNAIDIRGVQGLPGQDGQDGTGGDGTGFNPYRVSEQPIWIETFYGYNGKVVTDASVAAIPELYSKSNGKFYKRLLHENRANGTWFGLKSQWGQDQFDAFQVAIEKCIRAGVEGLNLPEGILIIREGVVVVRDEAENIIDHPFCALSLYGTGNAYDPVGLGVGTGIRVTDPTDGCVFLQKVKGVTIQDIHFYGANMELSQMSREQIYSYYKKGVGDGVSNFATAPHGGLIIDAFYTGATANKYPKKSGANGSKNRYIEVQNNGSTGIKIVDCYFRDFAVGLPICPGGLQNGEHIHIIRPSFANCSSSVSLGDTQNRTVRIDAYWGWVNIMNHINTRDYSAGGAGMPPVIYGLNIAGNTKSLCKLGGFYGNDFIVYGSGHTELMKDINGCEQGRSCKIHLHGCQLYLTGSLFEDNKRVRYPNQIAQCNMITFTNSILTYYSNNAGEQTYFSFMCNFVKFENCEVSAPIMVNNGRLKLDFCIYQRFNLPLEELTKTRRESFNAQIISINEAAGTYTFNDNGTLQPEDYIVLFPKTSGQLRPPYFNGELFVPGGQMRFRNGNTVTAFGIVDGLEVGQNVDIYADAYTAP